MTRILQVRRGTAAQNNNFTGLTGEVSFDTDGNTLRVHDGQTLGGYALARADQITGGTGGGGGDTPCDFDINSVPAAFWQSIITTYAPNPWQVLEGRPSTIANVSYLEYIFNLTSPIKMARVVLVCQTPEADYAIGDIVPSFGIDSRTNPAPYIFSDIDGQHVRLFIGKQNFWVSHKTTGLSAPITNNRWKAKFIVWY